MLISFVLQFVKYEIEAEKTACDKYLHLVKWWDSMNATERHHCFLRYENEGLGLNFKYNALGSYLKIYENEIKLCNEKT